MIRPEGAAAVSEGLADIANAVRHNLTAALVLEAEALQTEAKRRCPVDTGTLRDSIHAAVQARGEGAQATIGSGLEYAAAVELGTLKRLPRPYLAPAFRARRSALIGRVRQAVRHALKREGDI